jgi:hypothetical protein
MLIWLTKLLVNAATTSVLLWLFYMLVSRMSDKAKAFWIGVFSDNGSPSFSRVASGVILVACLVWDTLLIFHNLRASAWTYSLPDFTGQVLLISTPYGLNVTGKAIERLRSSEIPPAEK